MAENNDYTDSAVSCTLPEGFVGRMQLNTGCSLPSSSSRVLVHAVEAAVVVAVAVAHAVELYRVFAADSSKTRSYSVGSDFGSDLRRSSCHGKHSNPWCEVRRAMDALITFTAQTVSAHSLSADKGDTKMWPTEEQCDADQVP